MRKKFEAWLENGKRHHKYPNTILLASMDIASSYAISKRILSQPLWSITDKSQYIDFFVRLKGAGAYTKKNPDSSEVFDVASGLYIGFLEKVETESKQVFVKREIDLSDSIASEKEEYRPLNMKVDFSNPEDYQNLKPINCRIKGKTIHFNNPDWKELYVAIVEYFVATKAPLLDVLHKRPLYGNNALFRSEEPIEGESQILTNGKWLYTKLSPKEIVVIIRSLCRFCGIDMNDVVVTMENINSRASISGNIVNANSKQVCDREEEVKEKLGKENEKHENVFLKKVDKPGDLFSDIVDFQEGKKDLIAILDSHFYSLEGYSNLEILWKAAQDSMSMFLNDNAINDKNSFWSFIERVFLKDFVLSKPHIWRKPYVYPKSTVGIIMHLARNRDGTISREEVERYFRQIGINTPTNYMIIQREELLFYKSKHFILTEMLELTKTRCDAIEAALDRLFEQEKEEFIILRDIGDSWFLQLPAIEGRLEWTALLLQETLRIRPDISYRTIFSGLGGQAHDTVGVAVVHSGSMIRTFSDVAHSFCRKNGIIGERMEAEKLRQILRNAGMLSGNELYLNLHRALKDPRFAFTEENYMVKILEH